MRTTKSFLFLVLPVLLLGCATVQKSTGIGVDKPKVDVTSVSMETFSLEAVGGQLELAVLNPNPIAVPLRYIDWELSIAGDRAVTGRVRIDDQIPAMGSLPVSAALEVLASDAERVAPHLAEGLREYQLRGQLHFATAAGDLAVPFESYGTL
jgi:hypothetical protein